MKCENCDKMHWGCCFKPMLGGLLWLLAAISFIVACYSSSTGVMVWGKEVMTWYWNALTLGVLALGCKIHCSRMDCGMCGMKKE